MTKFEYLQSIYDYGMALSTSKFVEHRPCRRIRGAVMQLARFGYARDTEAWRTLTLITLEAYKELLASKSNFDLEVDILKVLALIEEPI